ncbi:protein FREE1-like isoform X1 [Zingiber officinale]|uniref:FYVE-type domain-containing protein n=1 Tax=Zingiber officinale TaxID=94328 RepID=A0A8J5LND4_ZINOF|nr:protein FREE1-like isoform X1 [Zingiber officinale]KAG6519814.1 hypothetical protein ZIOFF_023323 [Zingiber officinale]
MARMHHNGDFTSPDDASQYPPPPSNPYASELHLPNSIRPSSYASAPPFSQFATDYYGYSSDASAAAYSHNLERVPNVPPLSVPHYQPQLPPQTPQCPTFPHYYPSPEMQPSSPTYPHLQDDSLYYRYDPNHPEANYASQLNSTSNLHSYPTQSSFFSAPFSSYIDSYEIKGSRFDQGSSYLSDNPSKNVSSVAGGYGIGIGRSGSEQDFYGKKPESPMRCDPGDGIYAYDGAKSEPHGARGRVPSRSSTLFDDYGRSLSFPSSEKDQGLNTEKIVRAVPTTETQQDVKNGVLKFRVKILPEGGSQSTMDVLCQIGLDGIRMLDPSTSRTLRIYPLENVTKWEVIDSSIFAFWSKSSVDKDPRRVRLQSNIYTMNTILDIVTAAVVQLKEIGGNNDFFGGKGTADTIKQVQQSTEKKKGFDWMNLIRPPNEEKDHWLPDEAVSKCSSCGSDFGPFNRKHHCRNCGDIFCDKCTQGRIALTADEDARPVRVCDRCSEEVSRRLNISKEAANKSVGMHSHEELARKLQAEMDKNRKPSSADVFVGSKSSDNSGKKMTEIACPICTVHLQVQVPASGSETMECSVCQNPFLVSAR